MTSTFLSFLFTSRSVTVSYCLSAVWLKWIAIQNTAQINLWLNSDSSDYFEEPFLSAIGVEVKLVWCSMYVLVHGHRHTYFIKYKLTQVYNIGEKTHVSWLYEKYGLLYHLSIIVLQVLSLCSLLKYGHSFATVLPIIFNVISRFGVILLRYIS